MFLTTTTSIGVTILEYCIAPFLALITGFLVTWINAKRKEVLAKTNNEIAQKYINIAADVINSCVITTTETYVKSLKNQNLFDANAQKTAIDLTKEAVMTTLSNETKTCLTSLYGDLDKYIQAKIEEAIKSNK